ncbi:MAG: hypothetical protein LBQ43_00050, partial [Holosporales bacterium]|nr:hypothetical protein [Holosporales bacterium]
MSKKGINISVILAFEFYGAISCALCGTKEANTDYFFNEYKRVSGLIDVHKNPISAIGCNENSPLRQIINASGSHFAAMCILSLQLSYELEQNNKNNALKYQQACVELLKSSTLVHVSDTLQEFARSIYMAVLNDNRAYTRNDLRAKISAALNTLNMNVSNAGTSQINAGKDAIAKAPLEAAKANPFTEEYNHHADFPPNLKICSMCSKPILPCHCRHHGPRGGGRHHGPGRGGHGHFPG